MLKQFFSPRKRSASDNGAIQRWVNIWNVLEYLMLAIATALALLNESATAKDRWLVVGFGVLYAAWFTAASAGIRTRGRGSRLVAVSFALMIPVTALMTQVDGIYNMLLFSLYGLSFAMLDIRLAIGVTTVLSVTGAVTIIWANKIPWPGSGGVILSFALATGFAILFGFYLTAIITQSVERQALIEKLQAAQESQARAERQAGILEERQRLAREIHDTLAQGFTSVVMHLEVAEQDLPAAPEMEQARKHIDQARTTARESLAEARRFVWALRSGPLEGDSLSGAIRRVAARWSEETGVAVNVTVDGEAHELPAAYEVALLRTAQESLANIRKHAQASQVTLTLTYLASQVSLDVADNGQGFDLAKAAENTPAGRSFDSGLVNPGAAAETGYGLLGLRERVAALGGTLNLESAPGEGVTLAVALPLISPNQPEGGTL